MICPECGSRLNVIDSRGKRQVLRQRRCSKCHHIIFTLEKEIPYEEGHDRYLAAYYKIRKERRS